MELEMVGFLGNEEGACDYLWEAVERARASLAAALSRANAEMADAIDRAMKGR